MTLASPTLSAEFRPLRFALRELRGGLHGFRIFVACIALGVMAIAGVGSFSRSLTDGLAREGRVILGGDLAFTLIHREVNSAERNFLANLFGIKTTAMTDYMFEAHRSLFLRGLSLFHGWLPFLLVYLVWQLGYDRRALPAWVWLAGMLIGLPLCLFVPTHWLLRRFAPAPARAP